MAVTKLTSRSSCFPACAVSSPKNSLPRRSQPFESKMSPHGLRKRSAKRCNRYVDENFPVLSLKNRKPKPPNYLLIQDKTFHSLPPPCKATSRQWCSG